MKIFISWSGERSRRVAELLQEWMSSVVQAIDPWISTHNIEQGSVWFTQIFNTLSDVKVGIICLTPENKEKPWLLFEAGAIASKKDEARVMTLLIELEPTEIAPPLSQFNHTTTSENDIRRMMLTINNLLTRPLQPKIFENVFQKYWPDFENGYNKIIEEVKVEEPIPKRDENDILNEILLTVRRLSNSELTTERVIQREIIAKNREAEESFNNMISNRQVEERSKRILSYKLYIDELIRGKKEDVTIKEIIDTRANQLMENKKISGNEAIRLIQDLYKKYGII